MQFQTFDSLYKYISKLQSFDNEIKKKRLKKEFQILSHYENPHTSIQKLFVTSIGVQLQVGNILFQLLNKYHNKNYYYLMILDFEYPFNRPQVYLLKNNQSRLAKCQDLIDITLQNSNWGPSLMLTSFLNKISLISEAVSQDDISQLKAIYHNQQVYRKQQLKQMKIALFDVQQYTWKFLIKSTHKKILGLTDDNLLLFEATKRDENILLKFWKPINQLTTAKASVSPNKKFSLQITYPNEQKQVKLYFGGSNKIQQILGYLNPIQMIERRINNFQKQPIKIEDNNQWINQFTKLIQYYSVKDPIRAEMYMNKMKQFFQKCYSNQPNVLKITNQQPKLSQVKYQNVQIRQEDIKT